MKTLKAASAIFCVATLATICSPSANADNYNKRTTVTFSGPVEIPGVHLKGYSVLPAGTYIFKLMDSTTNRHIVQITTADGSKTLATILAIPDTRVKRTDKTVITFRERPNGEPPALRTWFYPGAAWGEEFVYGKSRAKELAKDNNTPVLYSPDESQQAEVTEPIAPPAPQAAQQMDAVVVQAYSPAGEEMQLSQAVTPPPPANMQTSTAPATLPKTASPLGFLMLSGLLALGGALGVRSIRQRSL